MVIQAKNISKKYNDIVILNDINLNIHAKEMISITGPSGAGKSTLLQILGTLDKPDTGEILIDNIHVLQLKEKKLAEFRNTTIGFIFQFHNLLPEFTAIENICMPAYIRGEKKEIAEKKALDLLDHFGLIKRKTHYPSQLSGGEQQRIAVARALINQPKVIFADEPSGNLDQKNANELHQLFSSLRKEFEQTFVIVTHNKDLANLSDRILHMEKGVLKDI